MKKFAYVVAAATALAFTAPIAASAQTVVIKERGMHRHHDGYRNSHAYMHRDRGWHRGHHKKVIVIKRGRGHHHHW